MSISENLRELRIKFPRLNRILDLSVDQYVAEIKDGNWSAKCRVTFLYVLVCYYLLLMERADYSKKLRAPLSVLLASRLVHIMNWKPGVDLQMCLAIDTEKFASIHIARNYNPLSSVCSLKSFQGNESFVSENGSIITSDVLLIRVVADLFCRMGDILGEEDLIPELCS